MSPKVEVPDFVKYPELIDYIHDLPAHKKHLLFVNATDEETFEPMAEDISKAVNKHYNYWSAGEPFPRIPIVVISDEIAKGHTKIRKEYALLDSYLYGKCLIATIQSEPYDYLEAAVPQMIDGNVFVIASLKPGGDIKSLPPSFLRLFKVFDLGKGRFLDQAAIVNPLQKKEAETSGIPATQDTTKHQPEQGMQP
ncbi:MAG: hypothetical protein NUV74_13350 [Candidatus Brocadiaceae bacterium]|nr:hypothetical protein [Candidatus Brocadiaceae bacterium]